MWKNCTPRAMDPAPSRPVVLNFSTCHSADSSNNVQHVGGALAAEQLAVGGAGAAATSINNPGPQ